MDSYNLVVRVSDQKYVRAFYRFCTSMHSCAECKLKLVKEPDSKDCYAIWLSHAKDCSYKDIREHNIIKNSQE